MLATLQRDNFTKARKVKDGGHGMTALGRLKAVTFSAGIFVVGLVAFGFIFKSVYGMYFVSHAQAGLVSVQGMNITMPRDGTVQSLIKADGVAAKGARWRPSAPACSTYSKAIWTKTNCNRPRLKSSSASK